MYFDAVIVYILRRENSRRPPNNTVIFTSRQTYESMTELMEYKQ